MNLVCPSGRFFRFKPTHEILLPSHPNVSIWNSVFKSCIASRNSRWVFLLFRQLLQTNVKPNDLTFSLLIKASSSSSDSLNAKQEAFQIHTHLLKSAFDQFVYVSTALLDFYAKSGCISIAHQLFQDMPHRDLIAWNALICGYSRNGYDFDALELFIQMLKQGISPCRTTLVSVVPSCARPELLFQGRSIFGFGVKTALDLDSRVKNALTSMYAKCADLDAARLLFEGMSERCVISWNTMIGAYAQNGFFDEALLVFKQMREEGVGSNSVTIVNLLSAKAHPDSTHSYAIKTGVDTDASVFTSLVCLYAKGKNTESAGLLYETLPQKDLISLTAVISSYAEKGNMGLVLECFAQMQHLGMKADAVAIVSILHGFTDPTYIDIGVSFHGYGIKSGFCADSLVVNGLISMYTKFNDTEAAFSLFLEMHERPLISWNSMISSCVQAGRSRDAMELFCQMKMFGYNPDLITVTSVLSGSSQLGSLQFGRRVHNYILRNNLEVEDFVGTALIDMYAKCGSIESAERVFKNIEEPCLATWNTMISGYGLYGLEHQALSHYFKMIEQGLQPDGITFLGVLSACAHAGLVHEGQRYFRIMREEFSLAPGLQHFACMVDLFGRAGLFNEAITFIKNMEVKPDSVVWAALLGACCIHKEIKLGECLAKQIFLSDYRHGGFYVLISNLYAATGRWDDVARMREMMRDTGGDGSSGISLIEFASTIQKRDGSFDGLNSPTGSLSSYIASRHESDSSDKWQRKLVGSWSHGFLGSEREVGLLKVDEYKVLAVEKAMKADEKAREKARKTKDSAMEKTAEYSLNML
ncbi:hypothetical protein HHK36_002580 [Tetracentron sinense]|uniref:Pentatricopeptide repeat-containing protein n=1 Tax=Tetracentron sinense TaxID=13715 RepID=A0A835DN04_TETSI|nr:hypothetical protein HHK36_002580 [Tetracentron sinense]